MSRPKNKDELLTLAKKNFESLLELVNQFEQSELSKSGVCEKWSVKDILVHLHAWHELLLNWYKKGMKGDKPEMPAPGYSWKNTPQLNEKIYQDHKDWTFEKVLSSVKQTHKEVVSLIKTHSQEELFTKKKYSWTGSSSLAVYLRASTSSHYDWAIKLIKKWKKCN